MSSALTRSTAHGAVWTGISQLGGQGLRLIGMTVLARLLLPEDFGIVAMITIFSHFALRVVDMGFNEAIIQRKEATDSHLSTAFWAILALGIILCAITVAISPLVASFFDNAMVRPVLTVSSLAFIILPLSAVHAALLKKRLSFFKSSVADIGEAVTYLVVAVAAAIAGLGVWSLVIGSLAGDVALVVLRWVLCRWHPSLTFSISRLKDLWGFGVNITGTRLANALGERLDYLLLGRFLSATVLGFYSMAVKVGQYPSGTLQFIVARVALPAFSLVQDEQERLRRGFLKSVVFASIIGLPVFAGLAVVTPELIKVVFGEKWVPSILPLRILCLAEGVSILSAGATYIFLARGKPGISLKLSIAKSVLMVPSLLVGVQFGATGVAVAIGVVAAIIWPIRQLIANRFIGLRMRDYLASLRPAAFGSFVMAISVFGFRYALLNLFTLSDVFVLVGSVALGIAVYFALLKLIRTQALDEMIRLVIEMVTSYAGSVAAKIPLFRKGAAGIIHQARQEK